MSNMIPDYRYRPGIYFATTFIVTYALWFAGAYVSFQEDRSGLYMLLMIPGLMAPFMISLIMIIRSGNIHLRRDFLNRLTNLRLIRVKMLPLMFLLMPFTVILSILLSLPFGGSISQFSFAEGFSFSTGFVPVLLVLLLAAGFEELGWRGYAFDSLQSRYTYFKASVIFGILWSIWHFPLVFVNNSYQYEVFHQSLWYGINFFVSIIPMGIIISWFCIHNGKSVIAAILFHFVTNISQELLAITQFTKCIQTVVLIAVVAIIVLLDKELFFSRAHPAGRDKDER